MPEGLVDWSLAERVSGALAGTGPTWDGGEEELRAESDRADHLGRGYTGLRPKGGVPPAELVGRDEWARINIESFRHLSARVEEHLEQRIDRPEKRCSGLQRTIVRAATGAEVGLAIGYLSQRVIGQYDVALIGPARAPRLLFLGPTLSAALCAP